MTFSLSVISAILSSSCTSVDTTQKIRDMAKEQTFVYFFPRAEYSREFSSLDEAYDFVNAAFKKMEYVSEKTAEKGLAARLYGHMMPLNKNSIVASQIIAVTEKKIIKMSNMGVEEIEKELKKAISIFCVFLVFYEGRGVSISKYYLNKNYRYVTNSQYKTFVFEDIEYKADYPIGWGVEKAFLYLKKMQD